MNRVTKDQLKAKILSFNSWHNVKLDTSNLGASGGMGEHLIIFGTQTKLTVLQNKTQLWETIDALQTFDYESGNTLKQPDQFWYQKYLEHKKTMGEDF